MKQLYAYNKDKKIPKNKIESNSKMMISNKSAIIQPNICDSKKTDKSFKMFQISVSNNYNMDPKQFIQFSNFFNDKSEDGQFIKISLVKKFMYICIKNRKIVNATQENIDHSLEAIKSYETKLDFEEFTAFLTFFFANKNNIEKRIKFFLKSRDFKQSNYLSATQAFDKVLFLFRFYNVFLKSHNTDLIYRFFRFEEDVSFDEFISQVYPFLKCRLFVKW